MTPEEVEQNGEYIDGYIVDESQTVSNAGHAEVFLVGNVMYEVITWTHVAENHISGQKTVTEIMPNEDSN